MGKNRWGIIEVPKKGAVTLTTLDLKSGQTMTTIELQRVGVGPSGRVHKFDTGRTLNSPSNIKTTSELANAMENSKSQLREVLELTEKPMPAGPRE